VADNFDRNDDPGASTKRHCCTGFTDVRDTQTVSEPNPVLTASAARRSRSSRSSRAFHHAAIRWRSCSTWLMMWPRLQPLQGDEAALPSAWPHVHQHRAWVLLERTGRQKRRPRSR